jgi:hypothetical protein
MRPMVILERGEWHGGRGQGRWSGRCYVCLDLDKISPLIHNYTNAERQRGGIANKTHLKHPATSLEHQSTSLDMSSAGAVDSISAVGSSGHGRCVKDMQLKRGKLERVITIK